MATVNREIRAENFRAEVAGMVDFIENGSLEPAMRKMKRIAEESIDENFRASSRADGSPWAERKHSYRWPILIKTGALRASTQEGGTNHIESVGPRDAMTGTDLFYAGFHQDGTRKMVARPFEEVSGAAVDAMEAALTDFILDSLG